MLFPENAQISEETIKPQCRALLARTPMWLFAENDDDDDDDDDKHVSVFKFEE